MLSDRGKFMPVMFLIVRLLEGRRPESLMLSFVQGPTVKKRDIFYSDCSLFFLFFFLVFGSAHHLVPRPPGPPPGANEEIPDDFDWDLIT